MRRQREEIFGGERYIGEGGGGGGNWDLGDTGKGRIWRVRDDVMREGPQEEGGQKIGAGKGRILDQY